MNITRRTFLKVTAGALALTQLPKGMALAPLPELKKETATVTIRGLAPGSTVALYNSLTSDLLYMGETTRGPLEVELPDAKELPVTVIARKSDWKPLRVETGEIMAEGLDVVLHQQIDERIW